MAYPQRQTRSRGNSHTPVPNVPIMQQQYKQPMPYQYATPTRPPSHAPRPGYPPQAHAGHPQHPQPQRPQVYQLPPQYPDGPLGFFLPPPGQRTLDPTLQTPPATQGLFTTYPSRLRTGVTSLMQPEGAEGGAKERQMWSEAFDREEAQRSSGANTPRTDSPAPRLNRTTTTTLSGRRAGRVNYAEKESSDEEEEEESEEEIEEAASDPEDDTYGERKRKKDDYVQQQKVIKRKKREEQAKTWTWIGDRVPAERVTSSLAPRSRMEVQPEEKLQAEAGRAEALVPISIDYDIPDPHGEGKGLKIKDRFLWNASEPFVKPLEFATIFCHDVGIHENNAATIAELIMSQVEEQQNAVGIDLATRDVTPDDVVFSDDETPADDEYPEPDCRIVVNLDVQIFQHVLRDRIEWDLSSPLPPSEFARHYCAELGLTGEAVPLVAHAIHEELIKHKRDALEMDLFAQTHPGEQAKWERTSGVPKTNSRTGAKGLVGVWRDWWERDEFSPLLVEISHEEMVKREQERSREARRIMRTLHTSKRRR